MKNQLFCTYCNDAIHPDDRAIPIFGNDRVYFSCVPCASSYVDGDPYMSDDQIAEFRAECQSDNVLEDSILAHVAAIDLQLQQVESLDLADFPTWARNVKNYFPESGQGLVIVALLLCCVALVLLAATAAFGTSHGLPTLNCAPFC